MGHDIDIVEDGDVIATTGITGNFTQDYEKWELTGVHRWHGRTGAVIAQMCFDSILKLASEGVLLVDSLDIISRDRNVSWGCYIDPATNKTIPFSGYKRKAIYAFHLMYFMKLGLAHPKARWYSDQVWELWVDPTGKYEDGIEQQNEESSESEEFE